MHAVSTVEILVDTSLVSKIKSNAMPKFRDRLIRFRYAAFSRGKYMNVSSETIQGYVYLFLTNRCILTKGSLAVGEVTLKTHRKQMVSQVYPQYAFFDRWAGKRISLSCG